MAPTRCRYLHFCNVTGSKRRAQKRSLFRRFAIIAFRQSSCFAVVLSARFLSEIESRWPNRCRTTKQHLPASVKGGTRCEAGKNAPHRGRACFETRPGYAGSLLKHGGILSMALRKIPHPEAPSKARPRRTHGILLAPGISCPIAVLFRPSGANLTNDSDRLLSVAPAQAGVQGKRPVPAAPCSSQGQALRVPAFAGMTRR
jgi:hypothetical protein